VMLGGAHEGSADSHVSPCNWFQCNSLHSAHRTL
jgi:hypothetical protein